MQPLISQQFSMTISPLHFDLGRFTVIGFAKKLINDDAIALIAFLKQRNQFHRV